MFDNDKEDIFAEWEKIDTSSPNGIKFLLS